MIETPDSAHGEVCMLEILFDLYRDFNIVWGTVFGE
jgi:hypothetical protein